MFEYRMKIVTAEQIARQLHFQFVPVNDHEEIDHKNAVSRLRVVSSRTVDSFYNGFLDEAKKRQPQ